MDQHQSNMDQTNEIFTFREPMVLLPILCLSLLWGITLNIDETRFFAHIKTGELGNSFVYYEIIQILAPLPGIILITFISEIKGRKIVFILLSCLCVVAAVLSYVPYQQPWAMAENFIAAALRAGVSTVTPIAICEYCRPKHRFAFLVANVVLIKVGTRVTGIFYSAEIISKESSYLSVCLFMVASVCLSSVYWWPESPYWLAGQGSHQKSKDAMLRLRKEGDDARRELHALKTSRRHPTPKVFWLALFVAFLTITVTRCAYSGQIFLTRLNEKIHDFISPLSYIVISTCVSSVVSLMIVIVSYKVQRKVIYLSAAIISIALLYITSIWAYRVAEQKNKPVAFYVTLFICNILLECGPVNLSLARLIELIPQKYNTIISCICYIYFFASMYIFAMLPLNYHGSFPAYGFMLLFATLAFVAILILYCLAPETRDKNLLQIEKLYINRINGETPEQDHIVLQDLPT